MRPRNVVQLTLNMRAAFLMDNCPFASFQALWARPILKSFGNSGRSSIASSTGNSMGPPAMLWIGARLSTGAVLGTGTALGAVFWTGAAFLAEELQEPRGWRLSKRRVKKCWFSVIFGQRN